MDCLLGLGQRTALNDCGQIQQVLDLDWQLYRSGDLIQQGKYGDNLGGGHSKDYIDAEFGYVYVKRGRYTLIITPTKNSQLLAPTNPRAHFEIASDYYVGSLILQSGSLFFGVFLIVVGSAIMAIQQWRLKRMRSGSMI
ncbi:hypothetical protein [Edaphobacter aggregans]|uniref:hypothetical protein n=1 Tax=Edaphobacter aggregans TaxID=570835 RepID=UPI0012FAF2F9|nr:hypothetical protein [Edaphobacter aggregans]